MARTYDNYADLITFTRASSGTALRPISYGDELVTNGTFDTGVSGWDTAGTGTGTWAVTSGSVQCTGATSFSNYFNQPITCVVGRLYIASVDVTSQGTADTYLGVGNSIVDRVVADIYDGNNANGFYSVTFVATQTTHYIVAQAFAGTSDALYNISIKEVLFDQPNGTLTLFNHPTNIPRIEYDSDGNRLGLLVEESRTNLLTYSEDFTDASWTKVRTGTLAIDATGPDGQTSAVTFVDDGGGGASTVNIQNNVTVSTNTTYTASIFAKADQLDSILVYAVNFTTPSDNGYYFNLSNGTYTAYSGTPDMTPLIQDVGNGWYRCSITFTTGASDTAGSIRFFVADGASPTVDRDGTSSILIYGAQFEQGSFPTSYIPTSGSTATRSADVASIGVSEFGYNQSEGTVVVDVSSIKGSVVSALGDGTFTNDLRFGVNGSNIARGTGSGFTKTVTSGGYDGEAVKIAIGIDEDNYYSAKNGVGAGVVDTSSSLPPNPVSLYIGKDYGFYLNGHIKSLRYIPRRLTNAQIEAITS